MNGSCSVLPLSRGALEKIQNHTELVFLAILIIQVILDYLYLQAVITMEN